MNGEEKMLKRMEKPKLNLNIIETECDCEKCSLMCHSPCCGTPEDIKKLIGSGYAKRLMFDDWSDGPDMIKPALKNCEGENAPWETRTDQGCTFWKDGKCELHNLGLKPTQAKLVIHGQSEEELIEIGDFIRNSWETEEAKTVIDEWLKICLN